MYVVEGRGLDSKVFVHWVCISDHNSEHSRVLPSILAHFFCGQSTYSPPPAFWFWPTMLHAQMLMESIRSVFVHCMYFRTYLRKSRILPSVFSTYLCRGPTTYSYRNPCAQRIHRRGDPKALSSRGTRTFVPRAKYLYCHRRP